jgi:hypothetical protein
MNKVLVLKNQETVLTEIIGIISIHNTDVKIITKNVINAIQQGEIMKIQDII